jgi:hypothetical protein
MALIGINGYSGSGKDTVGIIIQYLDCPNPGASIEEVCNNYTEHEWWLEEQSDWEIRKFAGKLKDIASHLTGIDIEDFEDQEFKKTNLSRDWWTPEPMTVRDFLQKLGTDALRNGLHPNVWVNALMADYIGFHHDHAPNGTEYPNWVVTDTRFPNEAQAIKDRGGIIIRVDRPGVKPINDHPSETGLDDWKFDYRIANVSDIYTLKETIRGILKHAKLL